MGPDWRLLSPELLQVISEKLTTIADFVRFRAVCPAWRSASSPRPRHLPPQLPWLILPRGPDADSDDADPNSSLSVYDLSQSKTHTLDLPQIHGKRICGCSHGWLVLQRERQVWLLNPITREQINLPSLWAQQKFFKGGNPEVVRPDSTSLEFDIWKAILSSNPRLDPDCLVMVLFEYEAAFCGVWDDCWTMLAVGELVHDIIYHNHHFYVIYDNGKVLKWDIPKPFYKIINSSNDDHGGICYFCSVQGTSDEHGLMLLCHEYSHSATLDEIYKPVILMLSDEQEIWSNAEEEHTSSYCFFLGTSYHCISLPLANLQLHGWDGNCICYPSLRFEKSIDDVSLFNCSIKLYKLDDRSVTNLASHLGFFQFSSISCFSWLIPSLC